jgi:hypothetical protein
LHTCWSLISDLLEFEFMFEFILLESFIKFQIYLPPSFSFQPNSQSSLEALVLLRAARLPQPISAARPSAPWPSLLAQPASSLSR